MKEGLQRSMRKLLRMMVMHVIFTVAMVSEVYTYFKTYQIVCFNHVHFILYQLYLNRVLKQVSDSEVPLTTVMYTPLKAVDVFFFPFASLLSGIMSYI